MGRRQSLRASSCCRLADGHTRTIEENLPDSGPQPVTLCQLCNNLHSAILDRLLALCGETSGTNRVKDLSGGSVTSNLACAPVRKVGHTLLRKGAGSIGGQIQNSVIEQLCFGIVGGFEGQSWDDMKAFGVNVGIQRVSGGPVKGTRSIVQIN